MATANKSLAVGATGSNVNVWATNITTPNFAKIDSAFGTILAVPFASSDVTLTSADLVYAGYSCTGTLGANCVLIFPATFAGFFTIRNACTGAFTLSARTSGGATIVIPQGGTAFVYTDGTDMRFADGLAADGQLVYAVDSGAADAYVITTPFPTPLKAGVTVWWKATNANTTASTLNVNGTGATAIKAAQSGADPTAGAIAAGGVYASTYDGTVWRTQGLGFLPSAGGTISGNLVVTGDLTVDDGVEVGSPTGGNLGTGTVNAEELYNNGIPVGALVTLTASAGAIPDYTSLVPGLYDIRFNNIVLATGGASFGIRFSAAASFITTASYNYQTVVGAETSVGGVGTGNLANGTGIVVIGDVGNSVGSNITGSASLIVGGATAGGTSIDGRVSFVNNAGTYAGTNFFGRNTTASQIDGIRCYSPSGSNVTSGSVTIFRRM